MRFAGPWSELLALRDRLTQLVGGRREVAVEGEEAAAAWSPSLDAFERAGRTMVAVEVPGVALADLRVRVDDKTLVIEGDRRPSGMAESGGRGRAIQVDRAVGPFQRAIELRGAVRGGRRGVRATLRRGVLEIQVDTATGARGAEFDVPIASEQ